MQSQGRTESKSWWQYLVVALLVAAGTFLVKSYFHKSNRTVQLSDKAKLREYVSAELPSAQANAVKSFVASQVNGSQEPDDCKVQRERLFTESFDRLMEDIASRRVLFNPACQAYDAKSGPGSFAEMIYKNCKSPDIENEQAKNACAMGLFFFKSGLVMNATKGQSVDDMDVQTLSHHLFGMLGTGEMKTPESLSKLDSVTDRLIELLPNSPGVYKAALIPRMIQEMNGSTPENTQRLSDALNKALELNPNDPQVEDINLFLLTREGRDISVEKAEAVATQHPESSAAQLFLAKAYVRKQSYEQATEVLGQLAQKFPNDKRIQEANAQMKSREYDKLGHFQIGLGSDDI